MKTMKPETKLKLRKIAENLHKEFGVEVINTSNLKSLITRESNKLSQPLAYLTIEKYQDNLSKMILNLEIDRKKQDDKIVAKIEYPSVEEPNQEVKKEIDFAIIYYTDGTFQIKPRTQKAQEPVVEVFIGLFDYNNNKVVIRRGDYSGCNVKSKSSILDHFTTFTWFETWCIGRLDDVTSNKITPNVDTPRDIETLKEIIKQLQSSKSDNLI